MSFHFIRGIHLPSARWTSIPPQQMLPDQVLRRTVAQSSPQTRAHAFERPQGCAVTASARPTAPFSLLDLFFDNNVALHPFCEGVAVTQPATDLRKTEPDGKGRPASRSVRSILRSVQKMSAWRSLTSAFIYSLRCAVWNHSGTCSSAITGRMVCWTLIPLAPPTLPAHKLAVRA